MIAKGLCIGTTDRTGRTPPQQIDTMEPPVRRPSSRHATDVRAARCASMAGNQPHRLGDQRASQPLVPQDRTAFSAGRERERGGGSWLHCECFPCMSGPLSRAQDRTCSCSGRRQNSRGRDSPQSICKVPGRRLGPVSIEGRFDHKAASKKSNVGPRVTGRQPRQPCGVTKVKGSDMRAAD